MSNPPNTRTRDLARIHTLKKALHWDDDLYRDVMAQVVGATSAADLDDKGRAKLLAHMQGRKDAQDGKPARPARTPLDATGRKLWSLWMQAADAGLVKSRTMAALNAWIKRQTGVERIEWLREKAQAQLAIESLKSWVDRGGVA
jgi:phage gp16-like protein